MTNAPANWYPDSTNPGKLRYWDGEQWTDHFAPDPAAAVVPPPVAPPTAAPPAYVAQPTYAAVGTKKSHTGLIIGLVAGGLVLVLIIVAAVVVIPLVVSGITKAAGVEYSATALDDLDAAKLPADFSDNEGFKLGETFGVDPVSTKTQPSTCGALSSDRPVVDSESSNDTVYAMINSNGSNNINVQAFGRVFPTTAAAASHVSTVNSAVQACSSGYTAEGYSTTAVKPITLPSQPGVDTVAWVETAGDTGGDQKIEVILAEKRIGNLVVRAECSRNDGEPFGLCQTWWDAVTDQMKALPTLKK